MGFLLGFMIGVFTSFSVFVLFTYWLCSHKNNVAVAKFVTGIAQALEHKSKTPEVSVPGTNGEATREAGESAKRRGNDRL